MSHSADALQDFLDLKPLKFYHVQSIPSIFELSVRKVLSVTSSIKNTKEKQEPARRYQNGKARALESLRGDV